jgi:hypothetical protein
MKTDSRCHLRLHILDSTVIHSINKQSRETTDLKWMWWHPRRSQRETPSSKLEGLTISRLTLEVDVVTTIKNCTVKKGKQIWLSRLSVNNCQEFSHERHGKCNHRRHLVIITTLIMSCSHSWMTSGAQKKSATYANIAVVVVERHHQWRTCGRKTKLTVTSARLSLVRYETHQQSFSGRETLVFLSLLAQLRRRHSQAS